jgi:hypothetical protein
VVRREIRQRAAQQNGTAAAAEHASDIRAGIAVDVSRQRRR